MFQTTNQDGFLADLDDDLVVIGPCWNHQQRCCRSCHPAISPSPSHDWPWVSPTARDFGVSLMANPKAHPNTPRTPRGNEANGSCHRTCSFPETQARCFCWFQWTHLYKMVLVAINHPMLCEQNGPKPYGHGSEQKTKGHQKNNLFMWKIMFVWVQ